MTSSSADNFFLDLFYPKICFFCAKEKTWLCPDCQALLEISPVHKRRIKTNLADLYAAASYKNRFVKKLVRSFKYEPFLRVLKEPLAEAILAHLASLDDKPDFSGYLVASVPLAPKRLRWRGFNQAEDLGMELAARLNLPFAKNALRRPKNGPPQTMLAAAARKTNIAGQIIGGPLAPIKGSNILLVDDIVTTGATMEECARVLKNNGALSVVGIAIAFAEIG